MMLMKQDKRYYACYGLAFLVCTLCGGRADCWQAIPPEKAAPAVTSTSPRITKSKILIRKYDFKQAGKEMEYVFYVPASYQPKKKMPLVMALHGLGSTPHQIMRYPGLTKLAEKYGFIVVAPWGYNNRGWYGSLGQKSRTMSPNNLGELSEKDVMNVLEIMRRDFVIDDQRIYLLGHSMGGGGSFHLGIKYPQIWAALGVIAPAVYAGPEKLEKIKHLPVIVIQGDKDALVAVKQTRRWVEKMKQLKMEHVYVEVAGGGHVFVAFENMPKIFEFYSKHVKKAELKKKEPKTPQPAEPGPSSAVKTVPETK